LVRLQRAGHHRPIDGDALVYKQFWHVSFMTDTPNDLMVSVIMSADKRGALQIDQEMTHLTWKERDDGWKFSQ